MWLVLVKEQKDFASSLEVCGTCDHLDAFPQSIVNSLSTILCSIAIIYALIGLCISSIATSCFYTSLAIASHK